MSLVALYYLSEDLTHHIFFYCSFAKQFWIWLQSMLNISVDIVFFYSLLDMLKKYWSKQVGDAILSLIINVVWVELSKRVAPVTWPKEPVLVHPILQKYESQRNERPPKTLWY